MIKKRAPNSAGQALVFSAVAILALCVALFTIVNVGSMIRSKMRLQNAADAAAKSAAILKARALNEISVLNTGIVACMALQIGAKSSGKIPSSQKRQWSMLFRAQARAFSLLAIEIANKYPWRAARESYQVAYLNGSGGMQPGRMPEANLPFPREPYGGIVFGDAHFPPRLGLRFMGKKGFVAQSPYSAAAKRAVASETYLGKIRPLGLDHDPGTWLKKSSLHGVAWRREPKALFGFLLERESLEPGIAMARANVVCPKKSGGVALFFPHWKAGLRPVSPGFEEQLVLACRKAGLDFWQGKEDMPEELIAH